MLRFLAALGVLLTGEAHAGAWPRTDGEAFLSFSGEFPASGTDGIFTTFYAEYGLTDQLTLGIDVGLEGQDIYKAVGFARLPINRPDARIKLAFELGVGLAEDNPVLRPGLMIGHGFAFGEFTGWMSVDTLVYLEGNDGDVEVSTDFTIGLDMSARTKLILQLQNGNHLMDPDYLKFAPSVVIEKKPGQHFELGMLAGLENSTGIAVKLGIWRSF